MRAAKTKKRAQTALYSAAFALILGAGSNAMATDLGDGRWVGAIAPTSCLGSATMEFVIKGDEVVGVIEFSGAAINPAAKHEIDVTVDPSGKFEFAVGGGTFLTKFSGRLREADGHGQIMNPSQSFCQSTWSVERAAPVK